VVQVSSSSVSATEPTVAAVPGNNLVVVWSDKRHGAAELYCRTRIGGVWSPEQRLTDLTGTSRSPAVAADPRGGVHLAWLYTAGGVTQVYFMYFPYTSPYATPRPVTVGNQVPDPPVVACTAEGKSFILWPDRQGGPATIWFTRFDPDSGITAHNPLRAPNSLSQVSVSAAVGSDGSLHVIWLESGTSVTEMHYQKRPRFGAPFPPEAVLERRTESMQNASIAVDTLGGIHLVMETSGAGVPQVRYKHYDPLRGWDVASTEVTLPAEATGFRPAMVVGRPGIVTIFYGSFLSGVPRLMERSRDEASAGVAAVESDHRTPTRIALRAGPNPLRIGRAFEMIRSEAPRAGDESVEFFDLAGRRVAAAPWVARGTRWTARLEPGQTSTWAGGVYLARSGATTLKVVVLR
jgi:hypothetical protein